MREERPFCKRLLVPSNKGSGKGKKGKKGKRGQGKGTKSKDADGRRKGPCHNSNEVGHFVRDCPKKKESNNASSSGGGNVHCLRYTVDQSQWVMMLAQVGGVVEQSDNIEFWVESGAARHARPCRTKPGSSQGGKFLTATGAPVGTLEVKFQLVDVHGERITEKAMFELLPVRRPILSVSRPVGKEFVLVMGNERGNKLCKNGMEIHLHKANGVYRVHASALSELCPLEDPRNDDAPPAEAVGEAKIVPWTRRLPHKPTEDERMSQSVSHLPSELVLTA